MAKNAKNGIVVLGKVGPVRSYQRNGKTYTRVAHNVRNLPLSHKSAKNAVEARLRFHASIVLWSVAKEFCYGCFSDKKEGQTDFNIFMSHNAMKGVFLTKAETKEMGVQVAVPLQISQGSVETIDERIDGGRIVTNLSLGELVIGPETTVGEFAWELISNNKSLEEDDELWFVGLEQTMEPHISEKVPKCQAVKLTLTLKRNDTRKLTAVFPETYLSQVGNNIATSTDLPSGCYTFVICHPVSEDESVFSTQTLLSLNDEMISRYTSAEQFELAAASYGGYNKSFIVN